MRVQTIAERGDDLIVTAARASFNRRSSEYTDEQNKRLIKFLVSPEIPHFAPLAHVRLTLRLEHWMIHHKQLHAYNKTGMVVTVRDETVTDVSHSLWGWYLLLRENKVHRLVVNSVIEHLKVLAPATCEVLELDTYQANSGNEGREVSTAPVLEEQDFVTLRMECPIVIARQLMKHQVGFIYSEASGRYIEYTKIHKPTELHHKPDNRKQGAGKKLGLVRRAIASTIMSASHVVSYATYILLHRVAGLATEEARYVMPISTNTTIVATASRRDWKRLLDHRLAGDAQTDVRVLAKLVKENLQ